MIDAWPRSLTNLRRPSAPITHRRTAAPVRVRVSAFLTRRSRSCKRFGGLVRRAARRFPTCHRQPRKRRWVGPRSSSSHIRPTILRSRPRHFVTLMRSAREPLLRLAQSLRLRLFIGWGLWPFVPTCVGLAQLVPLSKRMWRSMRSLNFPHGPTNSAHSPHRRGVSGLPGRTRQI